MGQPLPLIGRGGKIQGQAERRVYNDSSLKFDNIKKIKPK